MPANTSPIFSLTANTTVGLTISTANTAKDGTGTVVTAVTGGTNGTRVSGIIMRATGTNTASVLRVFLNNGSANSTATNNSLIGEMTLNATTLSEVAALATQVWVPDTPNFFIPSGYKLNLTIGTTVAAAWIPTCMAADY